MSIPDRKTIEDFLHGQVACWNKGDKQGFFAHYREVASKGLSIEYVGQPERDAWQVLEGMWAQQQTRVRIEVKLVVINGSEAACHHRNAFIGNEGGIETIELYRFEEGLLSVRYFIAA
ncbi:hypothetical protein [Pseudomonas abietaniphila]|uniref:SnoaL-like domain-containing protein n=1 Tax=Pseudomonas abietaniphila TaxID=89065 RepID=A0A1G7VC58_9PSED|nr:hypothetical protein [Pseudomonas abietaniphila]SDG57396.1 hypothetical protein SAMN05216605_102457 [Pseudomonas abietaniphila]